MNTEKVVRISLMFLFCIALSLNNSAQTFSSTQRDLSKVEVEKLTDAEVYTIIKELESSGLSEAELEQLALLNNMPRIEIEKLRDRITQLKNNEIPAQENRDNISRPLQNSEASVSVKQKTPLPPELSKIYGANLFNNELLTFEPSLTMSPPSDYILGTGDEIIIDIWGASKNYFEQTVDRNGAIRLNNVGPVQVSGFTLSQAENKIINKLSQIYSGLKGSSPNTFAQITLGRLKKIKVTLIGEVRFPGTYTLPSLASAFNALYLSGGPSTLGTFRGIEVIRTQKVVANIDVYEFLLEGKNSGNIQLKDQDIIRIPVFQNRVEMLGELKRPGIYEALQDETLADIIKYAGGFTKKAYKYRINVERYSQKERLILDITPEQVDTFKLRNGDKITVGETIDRFKNRVTINGAVFQAGKYELTPDLSLKELIARAEGLKPSAFMERGELLRELPDQSIKVISFDLKKIVSGETEDIILQREDVINISSIDDLNEEYKVTIEGDVQNPGTYSFYKNMALQALILRAGGFVESASVDRIEVARRVTNRSEKGDSEIAKLFHFNVSENLTIDDEKGEFILSPFDQVYVRRAPSYEVQKSVYIQGNIQFPGAYVLEKKDERISDLVKRAGGLNNYAYPEGAKLVRNYLNKEENIGIDLPSILAKPYSKEDLFLIPGDRLIIPKELQTVRINGEVLFPISIRYEKSKKFKSYVNNSGGFSSKAIPRKSIVKYANGNVKNTPSFMGMKFYPKIEPGAEIFVPTKPERREITTQEAIGWTTGFATLGLIIVNIIRAN